MDIFEAKTAWLHRKGTPYVWQFDWNENRMALEYHARKHTYTIRYCMYEGFYVARILKDKDGKEIGHVMDHKTPKPQEIEFKNGQRLIFAK